MRKSILLDRFPGRLKTCIPFLILSLLMFTSISSKAQGTEDVPEEIQESMHHEELQRGERFFRGLLPVDRKYKACESCHNIQKSDTLDWNPSAMAIAVKYANRDFADFKNAVMQPNSTLMMASHKDFQIKDEDLKTVKMYLDHLAKTGPPKEGPKITNLVIFVLLIILVILALVELIFLHKIKFRFIPALVMVISLVVITKMVTEAAINLGRSQNYAPDQPIKFSHKIHAGEYKIDCKYCHSTAEYSKSAGIPAVELCMNCHLLIREGTHSGKFEISKVVDANDNHKPIKWVRLHNLPDFVFFSHAQHVTVAKIACQKCHGPVQKMDITRQYSDLSMGWCVNCHRQTKVHFKDNPYYDNYTKLHKELESGKLDTVRAADIGANDCMRCHY